MTDSHRKSNETDISGRTKESASLTIIIALLLSAFTVAVGWQFGATQGNLNASNNYEKAMFYKDLNELGEKYRINEDSILQIKSGMYRICKEVNNSTLKW